MRLVKPPQLDKGKLELAMNEDIILNKLYYL